MLAATKQRGVAELTGVGGSKCPCSPGEANGSDSGMTFIGSADSPVNLAGIP